MPTNNPTQVVTVCFGPNEDADWFAASEKVDDAIGKQGMPHRGYRVRRNWFGWLRPKSGRQLVEAVRRIGSIVFAAGGRISRLDLSATVSDSSAAAFAQHQAWSRQIAAHTPVARSWDYFLGVHQADPKKISKAEAVRRFESQQRVLAMLAYEGPYTFDPYHLDAYQAGAATYAAVVWKSALVGDMLITANGSVMKPASASLADRLRFLNEAARYVRGLHGDSHLCAIAIN